MDAMAVLARTSRPAPTLLAATSPAVAAWGGRAARGRVSAAGRIVASSVEQSYIMIKPDGVQRGLVGEIISRLEKKGFVLKGLKLFQCPKDLAQEHYKDLKEKPFFPGLIEYITSGPVVCMAWEGDGVVASARKLIGATNPLQAEPGTIRGDLAVQTGRNVVHGSDSPDNGKREIALWFKEGELCEWESVLTPWLVE
uniref:Nucleoside diphosphate kinase n=1 Tax=Oryza nivara TaxID=4536 RepID=A0A0E0I3R1_ORYNI